MWVQTGPLTGPLGGRRALFRYANVEDVAVGARGDLAVTVLRPRSLQHGLPVNDAWLAVRRPGGAVRRTLVARGAGATAVAVNAGGDALLVYDRLRVTSRPGVVHRFFARLLTRHGRWMQGHAIGRVYSPNPGNSSDAVVAALDDDRRAVAGWRHHECEEGACFSAPAAVTVATRGAEFGRTIMLEQTTGLVVVSAGPRAVVAFSGPDGVRRAAVIGRGLGRPVQVSTPGLTAQVQGLAVDRRGAAALLWTESATANDYNLGEPSALRAIVRPAGGRFGAPESVLDEPVAYGSAVGLAFDRRTGGPVAAVHDAPFDTRLPDVPVVIARR